VILDERNLQSHLVKILHPDNQGVNGTGLFCHPEGYVITCYHVIAPYIQADRIDVAVDYQDETLQAQILKDYCDVDSDIAVIKLVEQEKIWPYLDLDVHKRWYPGDTVSSFGYPQDSSFRKTGIGITAKLVSATRDERTEVVHIVGDTLENVTPGFSGAPVLHRRTKKVIGLVNSKYELKQAFLVPLDTLYMQWGELRNFHDVFEKIRSRLGDEAQEKLNEKRKDTPFIPLRLECGQIPEKPTKEEDEGLKKKEWTHGRKWEDFDLENLLPITKPFILSSPVGAGKSTFLYWLVTRLVETTNIVPIFMTCSEFENLNPTNRDILREHFAKTYKDYFLEADFEDLFDTYFENKKLAFLFDGLDQIGSKKYLLIADRIFEICSPNSVLISSRPSSVISLESKPEILFLRLTPFSLKQQKQYFAEHFEKARRLSQLAPDLVRIPMLAYMVRVLIKDGKAEGVSNRTSLYQRFMDYIIHKHEPHIPISSDDFQLTEDVQETLKHLSFMALSLKEPQIQKIPMGLYTKGNFTTDVAKLTTFGLVNRVLEKGDLTQSYLFFKHRSFQEFLAAQYINEHGEFIDKVLGEMWAPKWKEIIKFLAGMRGQEVIERVYTGKDNIINSRLFLAAECVAEVEEINERVKGEINTGVRTLANKRQPFKFDAIYALRCLGDVTHLKLLIKDEDLSMREAAIRAFSDVNESVDDVIREIINWLKDGEERSAITGLDALKHRVDDENIRDIVRLLWDSNRPKRWVILKALAKVKDSIDCEVVKEVTDKLMDKDDECFEFAIRALAELKPDVDGETIRKITLRLGHESSIIRSAAIEALAKLKHSVDDEAIKQIIERLKDTDRYVREDAYKTLLEFKDRLSNEMIRKVAKGLKDGRASVRAVAINLLAEREDMIDDEMLSKIIEGLMDKTKVVSVAAISSLAKFRDRIDGEVIKKIITKLADKDRYVRDTAIDALSELADKLDAEMIREVAAGFEDKRPSGRIASMEVLTKLKDRVDITKDIAKRLHDNNRDVQWAAIRTLVEIQDSVDIQIVNKIINLIGNTKLGIIGLYKIEYAFKLLAKIIVMDKANEEAILKIYTYLRKVLRIAMNYNQIDFIRGSISAIAELKDKVDDETIQKIATGLSHEDASIRIVTIRALTKLKDRIDLEMVSELTKRLRDVSMDVRSVAIKELTEFRYRLDVDMVSEITKGLWDEDETIREETYTTLKILYESGIRLPHEFRGQLA